MYQINKPYIQYRKVGNKRWVTCEYSHLDLKVRNGKVTKKSFEALKEQIIKDETPYKVGRCGLQSMREYSETAPKLEFRIVKPVFEVVQGL